MKALAAAMLVLAVSGVARGEDYATLGHYEKVEVDAVLAERHREVDPAPVGKTIRDIVVVTRPVFSEDEGFLTFFNLFHYTTKDEIVRRELLFAPGAVWDQARVDESLRNLRDPLFHNVLVILPLTTDDPGKIDVLLVARDVWSLRVSTKYQILGTELVSLLVSVSENNLFGLRKRIAVVFNMDLGSAEVGPSYYDPNIAGSHLTLTALARVILARDGWAPEGTHSDILIAYPLWSLAQVWAASLHVAHYVGYFRSFFGNGLRTYDDPSTAVVEKVPWMYKRREVAVVAEGLRSFGADVVQRVGAGYELDLTRPDFTDTFSTDPMLRADFARDVLPRSEIASMVYARWQLFTPTYGVYRDIDTFDYREDYQLGPSLNARIGVARTELGSDKSFLAPSASAQWTFAGAGGLYRFAAGVNGRFQDGELIDQTTSVAAFVVSPVIGSSFRLLGAFNLDFLTNERNNQFFTLGGDNGMRGYEVGQFSGLARALGHLELRTRPLRLAFTRVGAVAFWDTGDCEDTVGDLSFKHDVGAGLRVVIPQLDQVVITADWAFALNGTAAGWPGRLSVGVGQVF